MKNLINLEDYRVKNAKVFSGRDRGKYVREKSKIDEIEKIFENVTVVIPANVYSIIPSFFEELFINVVLKLGKAGFYAKFSFQSEGNYNYEKPLEEAINRILRENTAIG